MKLDYSRFKPLVGSDKKFFQLLEISDIFELPITLGREILGIKPGGYAVAIGPNGEINVSRSDTKKYNEFWATDPTNKITKVIDFILDAYGLPQYWYTSIFFTLLYSIVISPGESQLVVKSVGSNGDSSRNIQIVVNKRMSVTELTTALEQDKSLARKLKSLPSPPALGHLKNIEVKSEIVKLRRKGKSLSYIARYLNKKYGESLSFTPTKESVQIYEKRTKALVKSLVSKKSKLHRLITTQDKKLPFVQSIHK